MIKAGLPKRNSYLSSPGLDDTHLPIGAHSKELVLHSSVAEAQSLVSESMKECTGNVWPRKKGLCFVTMTRIHIQ